MSLFEIFGEASNPGPVGSVEFGAHPARKPLSKLATVVRGVISLALLSGWAFVTWQLSHGELWTVAITVAITGAYCGLAYLVRPKPENDNVGWLGGLVDNPFRLSDDINRWLGVFWALLWPGRFVTESLVLLFSRKSEPAQRPTSLRRP